MASPTKRDGSTFKQFRKRIPADVLAKSSGMTLTVPVGAERAVVRLGESTAFVKFSLRTRDPREAKERQAQALTHLDAVWRSLREDERHLTNKETFALAGEWYREARVKWEDTPGPAAIWNKLYTSAVAWDETAVRREMAPFVEELVQAKALRVDADSRERLAFAMRDALREASALMLRRAGGDYGDVENPNRFPKWKPKGASQSPGSANAKWPALFDGWAIEARLANKTDGTIAGYRSLIERFFAFLGHDDAGAVTAEDVIRWKDRRLADGLTLKTVSASDLNTLRVLFAWGKANLRIVGNPAEQVKLEPGDKYYERERGFTLDEAETLLRAALTYDGAHRNAKLAKAIRWVPWLCAFTGSRVGEMAQLRLQDIVRFENHWRVTITPEAGPVKDKKLRRVVLHPQLVEIGFIDFVNAASPGYLFLNAETKAVARGPLGNVINKLGEFSRKLVKDERVAPNHGWRHRFQTIGREVDANPYVVNAICAHGKRDVSDGYGDKTLKAMATALAKYPRYELAGAAKQAAE